MTKNGVTEAFRLLIDEINNVDQEIKDSIMEAVQKNNHDKANMLIEKTKNLKHFQDEVGALFKKWRSGISPPSRKPFPVGHNSKGQYTAVRPLRAPASRLRVSFPDEGKTIEERYAADTFAQTIKTIGINQVRKLGVNIGGIPLIDSVKHDEKYGQREIDGWHICTHSSNQNKKALLDEIAYTLGIRLKVEILR